MLTRDAYEVSQEGDNDENNNYFEWHTCNHNYLSHFTLLTVSNSRDPPLPRQRAS